MDIGFTNERRDDLVFSDTDLIRLDPVDDMVKLKLTNNEYPISDVAYLRSPIRIPELAKFYEGFDADVTIPTGTSIDYRLGDGTTDYYWDGGAWSPATTTAHWSSEEDVADNILFFNKEAIPALDWPKITITARLQTTDKALTPMLLDVRLLVDTLEFNMQEELLYNSIIPRLKTLEFTADQIVETDAPTTSIDLKDYELGIELNRIVDVEAAYNKTDDPIKTTDIFDTKVGDVINFTVTVPTGKQILLHLRVRPQVAVSTHQDYRELAEFPVVLVERWEEVTLYRSGTSDGVRNKGQGTVKVFQEASPTATYAFGIACIGDHGRDVQRLRSAAIKALSDPVLHSPGIDQNFPVNIESAGLRFTVRPNLSDALTQRFEGSIQGIPLTFEEPEDGFIVKNVQININ
jgi:hypothetical protein